jgi:hypothetical protein
MKPGKAMFDFLVMREEGSRWRFRVQVEGTEPEPDDVIEIESGLLVTSTINFKMTNSDKTSAQFKAKFTSDSGTSGDIQLINFRSNRRRGFWLNSAVKALTSSYLSRQWSTVRRRKAN